MDGTEYNYLYEAIITASDEHRSLGCPGYMPNGVPIWVIGAEQANRSAGWIGSCRLTYESPKPQTGFES
jgi:hypothetical protein